MSAQLLQSRRLSDSANSFPNIHNFKPITDFKNWVESKLREQDSFGLDGDFHPQAYIPDHELKRYWTEAKIEQVVQGTLARPLTVLVSPKSLREKYRRVISTLVWASTRGDPVIEDLGLFCEKQVQDSRLLQGPKSNGTCYPYRDDSDGTRAREVFVRNHWIFFSVTLEDLAEGLSFDSDCIFEISREWKSIGMLEKTHSTELRKVQFRGHDVG